VNLRSFSSIASVVVEQREQEFQKLSKSYEEMLSYKNRVIKELQTPPKTEQKEK
jgi:hypothetical protein